MFRSDTQATTNLVTPELELHAYNAVFYDLGLRWHWDADTYEALRALPAGQNRLRTYLENHQPHLLKAYDADFLSELIETRRRQMQESLRNTHLRRSAVQPWANARTHEIGH